LAYSCNLVGGDKSYNLTTTVSPEEGGTIDPPSGSYESGVQLSVRANPSEGWRFDRWEGDFLNITVNPVNISMTKDHNVIAVFKPRDYPLHISIEGEGVVEEEILQQKATEYPFGTIVQLTAVPQEGWQFGYWEGDVETTENPTIIEITTDNNVTAVFEHNKDRSFLEEYAQREDVNITASGLMYRILREGDGESPGIDSRVRVHYEASLVSGEIIASTYERNEPLEFNLSEVIAGFAEGVMLMREGAKYELVIPAELGYGDFPPDSNIHPGATLIFLTELLEVL